MRVHYRTPIPPVACGNPGLSLQSTRDTGDVTCKNCRGTDIYHTARRRGNTQELFPITKENLWDCLVDLVDLGGVRAVAALLVNYGSDDLTEIVTRWVMLDRRTQK